MGELGSPSGDPSSSVVGLPTIGEHITKGGALSSAEGLGLPTITIQPMSKNGNSTSHKFKSFNITILFFYNSLENPVNNVIYICQHCSYWARKIHLINNHLENPTMECSVKSIQRRKVKKQVNK